MSLSQAWHWWLPIGYGIAAACWMSLVRARDERLYTNARERNRQRIEAELFVPMYLVWTGLASLFSGIVVWSGIGRHFLDPSPELVLPLPSSMRVAQIEDRGCGSQICHREIIIDGARGQSTAALLTEVTAFLEDDRDWELDEDGTACRDSGLVETCILVEVREGRLSIWVSDHSVWL